MNPNILPLIAATAEHSGVFGDDMKYMLEALRVPRYSPAERKAHKQLQKERKKERDRKRANRRKK